MLVNSTNTLAGRVALVAGATRGAGRGIACELGSAGATVYCTGRSVRGQSAMSGRPESVEDTADMVSERGGAGIAVQVDHTDIDQVRDLVARIRAESGRLDILVNDIWGGDPLTQWGVPFWEHSLENGLAMQIRGLHTHLITSHAAVPLMIESGGGLLVEMTDGDNLSYRGSFYYDLVKASVIRVARNVARELRPHGVVSLAISPGFLRSEAVLDHFGVTEQNWRDGAKKDQHFIASETPFYVGRVVAALAADPRVARWSGRVLSTWKLAPIYGITDVDGSQPNWGKYFEENVLKQTRAKTPRRDEGRP